MANLTILTRSCAITKTMSAADAKAHFAECLSSAETGTPVIITRYGKVVAAIVSADELDQLERLRRAGPEAGLGGLVGLFDDGDELADALKATSSADSKPVLELP